MCQISLCNLHDSSLNKKILLLMTTIGSVVHKDGWGIADASGHYWKCAAPMHYTTDSGKIIRERLAKSKEPLLAHIRQASPRVPVTSNNAHPFIGSDIIFVHNGRLTPKEEKNFVMEEEVDDLDVNGKQVLEKNGSIRKKKVAISDSLIFFNEFLKWWEAEISANKVTQDEHFIAALRKTMELFTGKFAFVFIINKVYYVVRGKTADLHIVYQMNGEVPTGFVINTSKETLDDACLLLDNLNQLEGKAPHNFTYPALLKEETIFRVENDGLVELGEIKENVAVTTTYWTGATGFTGGKTHTSSTTTKTLEHEKLYEAVFKFMESCSLGLPDISYIFFALYRASLEEVTPTMLKHFVGKVIPIFMGYTTKDTRKLMRRALGKIPFGQYRYRGEMQYPWFLNPKKEKENIIKGIETVAEKK